MYHQVMYDRGAEDLQTSIQVLEVDVRGFQSEESLTFKKVKGTEVDDSKPGASFEWFHGVDDMSVDEAQSPKKTRSKSISLQDFNYASRALLKETSPSGMNESSTTILGMLQELDVEGDVEMSADELAGDTPRIARLGGGNAYELHSCD
eukprot:TRINITY_DN3873_c0_g1_i1.p1 TRINITY_DN3873_c0_g1~~TRINITY_DN3873_c0_g1_i1.p1  ORF type:complete len:149 (-),score=38.08 TRINITY_DN3873_c0_g1_i1:221-667(-)